MAATSVEASSADALFRGLKVKGIEEPARTNQSELIKKILARYASNFVVFRELIQNSDDAQAKSFQLQFICEPVSDLANGQPTSTNQPRQINSIFGNIGKFFRDRFRRTEENPSDEEEEEYDEIDDPPEWKFHNKIITEIRTLNDGLSFTEVDWKRVITIADGNTNEDAIGQFGVGFFTVFAYSDKPMIISGKQCLAFDWKGESLTTFRHKTPVDAQSSMTSVILMMRDKYVLDTKSIKDLESESSIIESPNITNPKGAKDKLIPKINLSKLKVFFLKVLSFTKYINELTITINGETIFQVKKSQKVKPSSQTTLTCKESNLTNPNSTQMLLCNSIVHAEQRYKIAHGPSITLDYLDVVMTVNIDKEFHDKIRDVIRKRLPSTIHIKLLFPSKHILQNLQLIKSKDNTLHQQILNTLIPLKFQNNKIIPSGQIFIGLATHQSTGLGIHVHSPFIPTVERENLDFQDPYAKQWNEEIIQSIGKISRLIYDQIILDKSQDYNSVLAIYSFLSTAPNKDIGNILIEKFFSRNNLLVPVKETPSADHMSLVPSTNAFLSNSESICSFLSKPLVPFDLGKNDFFTILQTYARINEIDYSTIISDIHKSIFSLNEFIELLHWLCTKEVNNKLYIQKVLSVIRFRETINSPSITLNNIAFYDGFKIPSDLPLPWNILPSNIACHLSCEQLNKKLFLSEVPLEYLLRFYIDQDEQQKLFCIKNTSTHLLTFLSQHWNQLNESVQNRIKTLLSQLKCIPTTKGMQLPKDSYIYSSASSKKGLPIITLKTSQVSKNGNDNDTSNEQVDDLVSIEFLKGINCRTIYTGFDPSIKPSSNAKYNQDYIQNLLRKRKDMSDADISDIKQSKSLYGRSLNTTADRTGRYSPRDLHFPTLENELDWPTLIILDWPNIDPHSPEYLFLKELGVREVPELYKLINRIVEEHQQSSMIVKDYELPTALSFLASNFHKHYIKLWNVEQSQEAFLPCYYSTKMMDTNANTNESKVFLSAPNNVFTDESPLFPTPIPVVIKLFKLNCDISLIGVKQQPPLDVTFKMLMQRKNELLRTQTASKLFAYLSTLGGLNRNVIQMISQYAFIPLQDRNTFVKPTEVFIHSNNSLNKSNTTFDDEEDTNGLIDYIDYGPDANSFLLNVGVLLEPPTDILATLLLDRQAKYFSDSKNNSNDRLAIKLRVYTNCLKKLASEFPFATKLQNDPLRSRLRNEPWCLAHQTVQDDDQPQRKISKIMRPHEIYLNDDEQYVNVLKPLCAPEEPALTKLYEWYGAKWLSECVKRTLLRKGDVTRTKRANELRNLIQYRLNLLFVNKRGERMNDANEQQIEMLGTNLTVYETSAIQCKLTFEDKTLVFDSKEYSSCVLECEKNQVNLFIQDKLNNFEYFDIANELARFVFKKPADDIIDAISNRLSSSLDVLRRRGMPVDRLIKPSQEQVVEEHVENSNSKPNGYKHRSENVEHETRSGKSIIVSKEPPIPSTQHRDNIHNPPRMESNFGNHVEDFSRSVRSGTDLIHHFIRPGQPYSSSKLISPGCAREQVLSECEAMLPMNMTRFKDTFHSIPLFVEEKVTITPQMIRQGKQLAWLLVCLVTDVFTEMPINAIHLFRDIDGDKIAFNSGGSIFFNLRYYEQVFAKQIDSLSTTSCHPIITKLVNFYFVVTCHELTHHKHKAHDLHFTNGMEALIVELLPRKDEFLKGFSLSAYL